VVPVVVHERVLGVLLDEVPVCDEEHGGPAVAVTLLAEVVPANTTTSTLKPLVDVLEGGAGFLGKGTLYSGGRVRVMEVLGNPAIARLYLLRAGGRSRRPKRLSTM
jgi:hypothetical protein